MIIPVTPLMENLPLREVGWERFEVFWFDYLNRCRDVRSAHRYGKSGSTQKGIDHFAIMHSGGRRAFQLKNVKQFKEADVKKAIEKTTYRADHYIIVIACDASTDARDEIDRHPNWELWDLQDISQRLREMWSRQPEDARRLVQHHFGAGVRRAFLGLPDPQTLVESENFFQRYMNAQRIFNHTWSLVGREESLCALHGFVTSDEKVLILPGRGGSGKSKLLQSFSLDFDNQHPKWVLRFLSEGCLLDKAAFDELPYSPCVVVVDDAHRAQGLAMLFEAAQQREQPFKIILVTRPHATPSLRANASRSGYDTKEILVASQLSILKHQDSEALALQALGEEMSHHAAQVAVLTRDCPLLTVVAGRFLKEKSLHPNLLERDETFRFTVLDRFVDEIAGTTVSNAEALRVRQVLALISAISPVLDLKDTYRSAGEYDLLLPMAQFLGIEESELRGLIDEMERAGILVRRGRALRIAPDVVSDHLLWRSCMDEQGRSTGYGEQVFNNFAALCAGSILFNIAELDWRLRAAPLLSSTASAPSSVLLDTIWNAVETEFKAASHWGRAHILGLVTKIAHLQPKLAVRLAQFALHHPAEAAEDIVGILRYSYTHQDVLHALPELLRCAGANADYLPLCCELLWQMGRVDEREKNPLVDHPMNVLIGFMQYERGISVEFNRIVLDQVEKWLQQPDAHDYRHSPLDVLEPILARIGRSDYYHNGVVSMHTFPISRQNTGRLRARAMVILEACAGGSHTRGALRAVAMLKNVLRPPIPLNNGYLDVEEYAVWKPERLQSLHILERLASRNSDPFVQLATAEIFAGHEMYAVEPALEDSEVCLSDEACRILASLPDTFEMCIIRCLTDDYQLEHHRAQIVVGDDEVPGESSSVLQRKNVSELVMEVCRNTVDELVKRYPMPSDGAEFLNEWMQKCDASSYQAKNWTLSNRFLNIFGERHPDYASCLCQIALGQSQSRLARRCGGFAYAVYKQNSEHGLKLWHEFLDSQESHLMSAVALALTGVALWDNSPLNHLQSSECDVLKQLLHADATEVKRAALDILPNLKDVDSRFIIELSLGLQVGDDSYLAEGLFGLFDENFGAAALNDLTDADVRVLLDKLEPVMSLEAHHIAQFLNFAAGRAPRQIVELLLRRLQRQGSQRQDGYVPLPFNEIANFTVLDLRALADSSQYRDLLRLVRDKALRPSREFYYGLKDLFVLISLNFRAESLEILDEWFASGDPTKISAASDMLWSAPPSFVFANLNFVVTILQHADIAGEACHKKVVENLWASATHGIKNGLTGEPFPEDIKRRDSAHEVAHQLPVGSPARAFFELLARHAEQEIKDTLQREEEIQD